MKRKVLVWTGIGLGLVFVLYLVIGLTGAFTEEKWNPDYRSISKKPLGTNAYDKLFKQLFENRKVHHVIMRPNLFLEEKKAVFLPEDLTAFDVNNPLRYLSDFERENYVERAEVDRIDPSQAENYVIINAKFGSFDREIMRLIKYSALGGTVVIAAEHYSHRFLMHTGITVGTIVSPKETLNPKPQKPLQQTRYQPLQSAVIYDTDTFNKVRYIKFFNPSFQQKRFEIDKIFAETYFENFPVDKTVVLAENDLGKPVIIYLDYGYGGMFLTTLPALFSNYVMIQRQQYALAEAFVSFLPDRDVALDQFYKLGEDGLSFDDKTKSSLEDFFENYPYLRVTLYLFLALVGLYLIFGGKRRQRLIPLLDEYKNTSVEFVETVGRLYLKQSNHAGIAVKRYAAFADFIYRRYGIRIAELNDQLIQLLSDKSGIDKTDLNSLIQTGKTIAETKQADLNTLRNYHQQLENFYAKAA